VTPIVEGSSVTLQFEANNRANGNGGCNQYGGDYRVQGDRLTFSNIQSTLRLCIDTRINQQERDYLALLRASTRFELNGNELTILRDDVGRGTLDFVAR
jgi:heat shock protein HslJ